MNKPKALNRTASMSSQNSTTTTTPPAKSKRSIQNQIKSVVRREERRKFKNGYSRLEILNGNNNSRKYSNSNVLHTNKHGESTLFMPTKLYKMGNQSRNPFSRRYKNKNANRSRKTRKNPFRKKSSNSKKNRYD
jgi:hypothetical protein